MVVGSYTLVILPIDWQSIFSRRIEFLEVHYASYFIFQYKKLATNFATILIEG